LVLALEIDQSRKLEIWGHPKRLEGERGFCYFLASGNPICSIRTQESVMARVNRQEVLIVNAMESWDNLFEAQRLIDSEVLRGHPK
jgi:hypothetical protein